MLPRWSSARALVNRLRRDFLESPQVPRAFIAWVSTIRRETTREKGADFSRDETKACTVVGGGEGREEQ